MPSWVTHLAIADIVLESIPNILKHEFCVGNIAPDCNIENDDWTSFTPSREVTHFMSSERKTHADCDRFIRERITERDNLTIEELSFLLGYYSHLIADVEFQEFVRDEKRLKASWDRIMKHPDLRNAASTMLLSWDSVKQLINSEERTKDINSLERAYLDEHPNSSFLTEIVTLNTFSDYMDFLPAGAIVRKIRILGHIPERQVGIYPFVAISEAEYNCFIIDTSKKVIEYINKISKVDVLSLSNR